MFDWPTPRAIVPGLRFFLCDECNYSWSSRSRDCVSPSGEDCPCGNFVPPDGHEEHPEWPTDRCGNLLPEEKS